MRCTKLILVGGATIDIFKAYFTGSNEYLIERPFTCGVLPNKINALYNPLDKSLLEVYKS